MTSNATMLLPLCEAARVVARRRIPRAGAFAVALLLAAGPLQGADDYTPGLDECAPVPPLAPSGTVVTVGESRPPAVVLPRIVAVSFALYSSSARESASHKDVVLRLDKPAPFPIQASYTITGGSASNGVDYSLTNGTVSFAPGARLAPVRILLHDDALVGNHNKDVRLRIAAVTSNSVVGLIEPREHVFWIMEDDHLPTNYFVDAAAGSDDTHDGHSVTQAFRTVSHAARLALAGDTVFIRGGTYRENVYLSGLGGSAAPGITNWLTICAYSNETPVLKGSDRVTQWLPYAGAIWVNTNWAGANTQMVIDDDVVLAKLGWPNATFEDFQAGYKNPKRYCRGPADMTPGTFYYDTAQRRLFVWPGDGRSPTQSVMEVASQYLVLGRNQSFTRIRGLAIRHSNTMTYAPGGWQGLALGDDSVVEDCDIQWCDAAGLALGNNSRAIHCNVSNNGHTGVGWNDCTNVTVAGCTIMSNNWRFFSTDWHCGGIKSIPHAGGTVEGCELAYNHGPAIWFDACDSGAPIVIRNNYIHDHAANTSHGNPTNGPGFGVFIEISSDALVCNNVIVNSTDAGVAIHTSTRCKVFNNTVVGTRVSTAYPQAVISLYQEAGANGLPRAPYEFRDNKVANNVVFGTATALGFSLQLYNTNYVSGLEVDHNLYYRPGGAPGFRRNNVVYATLAEWTAGTGYDAASLTNSPLFATAAGDVYMPSSASPLVDAGAALPEVPADYTGLARPQGKACDIGAYEKP